MSRVDDSAGVHRYSWVLSEGLWRKLRLAAEARSLDVKDILEQSVKEWLGKHTALQSPGGGNVDLELMLKRAKKIRESGVRLLDELDPGIKRKWKKNPRELGPVYMKLAILYTQASGKKSLTEPPFNIEAVKPRFLELVEEYHQRDQKNEERHNVWLHSPHFIQFLQKLEEHHALQLEMKALEKMAKEPSVVPTAPEEHVGGETFAPEAPSEKPPVYAPTEPKAETEKPMLDALDIFAEVPLLNWDTQKVRKRHEPN